MEQTTGDTPAEQPGTPPEQASPDPGWKRGLTAFALTTLRTVTFRQAALGLFLVALLVSVPFGGMRAASAPEATEVTLDQPFDAAPFTITVTGARHGQDIGANAVPAVDGRYLVVLATVSTDQTTSVPFSSTMQDLVRLRGAQGLVRNSFDTRPVSDSLDVPPTAVLVVADGQPMGDLVRGFDYQLAFFFLQAEGQGPAPTETDVVVYQHTLRKSSFDGAEGWRDPEVAGEVTVPARPFTEAKDESS